MDKNTEKIEIEYFGSNEETNIVTPVVEKKNRKLFKFLITSFFLIILCFTIVFCYNYYFGISSNDKRNYLPENYNPSDYTSFELNPDRNISEEQLNAFYTAVAERLLVLGEHFEITNDGKRITVTVEKAMLGNTKEERNATVELIKSHGNIAFSNNNFSLNSTPTRKNIESVSVVTLNKAETMDTFCLEFKESIYDQINSLNTDVIFGLEIILDADGADKISDLTKNQKKQPKLVSYHDYIKENGREEKFFGSVLMNDDAESFSVYVISTNAYRKENAELMKLILEQDEFDFGFAIRYLDEPEWETEGKNMGNNQVSSIDGFTVIAEFSLSELSRAYNSEIECQEYEILIKERMDVLGIDYMFGKLNNDDRTYCIKVRTEDFTPDFFRMIFYKKEVTVVSAFDSIYGFHSPETVNIDGSEAIKMKCYYSREEVIADNEITENTVYLVVNDVTIASADISTMSNDDKSLCFSNFIHSSNSKPSENILNLLCHISKSPSMSIDGELGFRIYDSKGVEQRVSVSEIKWKYAPLTENDKNILNIVSKHNAIAQKNFDKRDSLDIFLDIPVNDSLAGDFLDKVKTIYTTCEFDNGVYNEICFIIVNEQRNGPANEYRICFCKDMYDGKMKVTQSIEGPDYKKYLSTSQALMENDSFFISHN